MSFTIRFTCACQSKCVCAKNQGTEFGTHANTLQTEWTHHCLLYPHANIRFAQLFDQRNHLEVIGLSMSKQPQMKRRGRKRKRQMDETERKIQSNDLCDVFIRHYLQNDRVSAFSVCVRPNEKLLKGIYQFVCAFVKTTFASIMLPLCSLNKPLEKRTSPLHKFSHLSWNRTHRKLFGCKCPS